MLIEHEYLAPTDLPGPEILKSQIRQACAEMVGLQLSIEDMVVDGDKVWARSRAAGRSRSGQEVTFYVFDVFVALKKGAWSSIGAYPIASHSFTKVGCFLRPQGNRGQWVLHFTSAMSVLGHSRRFRDVRRMSGLPRQQTFQDPVGTSQLGQSRHFAVQEDSEPFRAGPHEGLHRLAD